MMDFKKATPPFTYERNDYGHVHDNSGIHNYAAFRIMTAKAGGVFTPELAALFYVALTLQLSRTSQSPTVRGRDAGGTFPVRNESAAKRNAKIAAAERGFSAAGIG